MNQIWQFQRVILLIQNQYFFLAESIWGIVCFHPIIYSSEIRWNNSQFKNKCIEDKKKNCLGKELEKSYLQQAFVQSTSNYGGNYTLQVIHHFCSEFH
jgi:hypothetical protein